MYEHVGSHARGNYIAAAALQQSFQEYIYFKLCVRSLLGEGEVKGGEKGGGVEGNVVGGGVGGGGQISDLEETSDMCDTTSSGIPIPMPPPPLWLPPLPPPPPPPLPPSDTGEVALLCKPS